MRWRCENSTLFSLLFSEVGAALVSSILILAAAITCAIYGVVLPNIIHADIPRARLVVGTPMLPTIENPYIYTYGVMRYGEIFEYKKDILTAVQVHPMPETGTTMYDSQLTFCGTNRQN